MTFLLIAVAIALIIAALWIFGPRESRSTEITFDPTRLGDDLDAYLRASEAQIADLSDGSDKEIIWANNEREKTDIAVVYIHGFSANKEETRPLSDVIAKTFGANLYFTRLTGHGRKSVEAMGEASVQDWVNDFAEAMAIGARLGEKTILISTSTGGTIVTWGLADGRWADQVAASVFLAPNFGVNARGAEFLRMPFGKQLVRILLGDVREIEAQNDPHACCWTMTYTTKALVTMMTMVEVARRSAVEKIQAPSFFIYSPDDSVVDTKWTERIFKRWGSPNKKTVLFSKAEDKEAHVIAGRVLAPNATDEVTRIIQDWLAGLKL